MMPSIPETGSNLILEWYKDSKFKEDNTLSYISDHKNNLVAFLGYNKVDSTLCAIKLYTHKVDGKFNTIKRDIDVLLNPNAFGNTTEAEFREGKDALSAQYLSYVYGSNIYLNESKIIINCWDNNYTIMGISSQNNIVYANGFSTERIEEIYYLIFACKDNFFEDSPHLLIESEEKNFTTMQKFLAKYFESVHHIYRSLKEDCVGLETNSIADFNSALLHTYLSL